MKKMLVLFMLLIVINFTNAITIYDDFNRADNQDISEEYEGDFTWYEYPVNFGGVTPYTAHEDVFIEDNKLKLIRDDFCGMSVAVADFSEFGSLKTYEDGNITFTWQSGAVGDSDRWHTGVVFGENLWERETFDINCGSIAYNEWDIRNQDLISKINTVIQIDPARSSLEYDLWCQESVVSDYIFDVKTYTLSFDVNKKSIKLWIDDVYEGEFEGCIGDGTQVNSIGFSNVNNQAPNTIPYSNIDNLKVNLKDEEELQEELNPLLYKFAPVFIHHPRELYSPKEIESILNLSDLRQGIHKDLVKQGPLSLEDINNVEDRSLSVDLTNVDMYSMYGTHPSPLDFDKFESTIYGRITQDQYNYTYLQYFIFYPFQDWYVTDHEGDWQLVQVALNDLGVIEDVTYFFNIFKETYLDIDEIDLIEGHPVAYVAEGSHNMYGSNKINLPFLDELDEEQRYWIELLYGLKSLDKINTTGKMIVPESMEIPEEKYKIVEIKDETEWINYQGLFGERHILPYKSGQRGPKYNTWYTTDWLIPGRYTFGAEIPFLTVKLSSPLDIFFEDSLKNPIYFDIYTGQETEPEFALTTQEAPYKVILNATDNGMFNLSVFFYDGEKGINLKYDKINNTDTTRAELIVSEESDFKLCLDYEQDEIFDVCYYPNSILRYNGFKYEIPDKDNDGVDDLRDNCLDIENPLQEDFNDNNLGDLCDNPRFYKEKALELTSDKFSKKHIEYSLRDIYWKNQFEIKNPAVFLMELVATKKSNKEVQELLAKADKLIVEYRFKQVNYDLLRRAEKTRFKLAEKYYQKGIQFETNEDYVNAITYYFRAWVYLHNIH